MNFNLTPFLENEIILLKPLVEADYEALSDIASDPVLWEHHPISNGYTKEGFDKFFSDAVARGSLLIIDKIQNKVIGHTRIYDYRASENSIVIGHSFISRSYWGSGYNSSIKKLMFEYAFRYVSKIVFYVAENNIRSQKALEKTGAIAVGKTIRYYDGKENRCLVFEITKNEMT